MRQTVRWRFMLPLLLAVLMIFPVTELLLRLTGHGPFRIPEYSIQSQPSHSLLPDPAMGFVLADGEFDVTINEGLTYHARHADGHRSGSTAEASDSLRPDIGIFGCSYTYGMGVDDEYAFPYLLDKELEHYSVTNYAVPGYGTVQQLMQIRSLAEAGRAPDHAVFCYNGFHSLRNSMDRVFEEELWTGIQINRKLDPGFNYPPDWAFPYAMRYHDVLSVEIRRMDDIRPVSGIRRRSATAEWLKQRVRARSQNRSRFYREAVTTSLLEEIRQVCSENDVQLHVAFMEPVGQCAIYQYCTSTGIPAADIAVDLRPEGYSNLPYDHHPSPLAHQAYAARLAAYFRSCCNFPSDEE